jgi:hypothetical protein
MMDYNNVLDQFSLDLAMNCSNIEVTESVNGEEFTQEEINICNEMQLPEEFGSNNYIFFGFMISWQSTKELTIDATGSINILFIPEIFKDWDGTVYYPSTPLDSDLRDFKVVDRFIPEYGCGIYWGKRKDLTFHWAELDGSEPLSLDLDFSGYIEMLIASKGFTHWQTAILFLLYGEKYYYSTADDFKAHMPILFPDWTWEAFVQKFEEVRLHNVK